jgi:hypothetical protein
MSFWYTNALRAVMTQEINLQTADLRALLVMTGSTAETETDKLVLSDFTALSELDSVNYSRKAIPDLLVTADTANRRSELDGTDIVWTALAAGSNPVIGMVIYVHTGADDSANIPIAYITSPFTPNGSDVTVQWNPEGILHLSAV